MNDLNAKIIADVQYRKLSKKIMFFQSLSILLSLLAFYLLYKLFGESKSLTDFASAGSVISFTVLGYHIYANRTIRNINIQRKELCLKIASEQD